MSSPAVALRPADATAFSSRDLSVRKPLRAVARALRGARGGCARDGPLRPEPARRSLERSPPALSAGGNASEYQRDGELWVGLLSLYRLRTSRAAVS